jgi:hypothetical protein
VQGTGLVAGFLRQAWRLGGSVSLVVAIAAGRAVFVCAGLLTGAALPTIPAYLQAALLPGLPAAAAQVLLLPAVAQWWTRRESRS